LQLTPINLLGLTQSDLEALLLECGESPSRALELKKYIHQRGETNFANMTQLAKPLREKLSQIACVKLPEVVLRKKASDGTFKWLLRFDAGNAIETVFIPDGERGTLCVSSQVGCALNCSFCATGKEGFNRNLSSSEIISQLWLAIRELAPFRAEYGRSVTNVVLMGMGEPLLNYEAVLKALELMFDDNAYGLSKYRVTLSTSGVVPKMLELKQQSEVSLAVSLHAPNNALRNELVPLNKKYPLEVLMPVCRDYYQHKSKRQVVYEYVMLKDVNDTPDCARELIELLRDQDCKINLIPFNPFPQTRYETSTQVAIEYFSEVLMAAGFDTRVRRTRGEDIEAACGQLAGEISDRTGRNERWKRTGSLIPKGVHA
jgi:23S rRNA (adenine2503-C2)-methyltransferase